MAKAKQSKSDYQVGYDDAVCGLEERYPNNANYVRGFHLGLKAFFKEIEDLEPFEEDYLPLGVNDAHVDCNFY